MGFKLRRGSASGGEPHGTRGAGWADPRWAPRRGIGARQTMHVDVEARALRHQATASIQSQAAPAAMTF